MKKRRFAALAGALLLIAAGAAAAIYLTGRREVTTSSEEAYTSFQEALQNERRFYLKEARLGFARALELDPQFAEAMLGLARLSDREQRVSLLKRAKRERDRLTERERMHVDMQVAGMEAREKDHLEIARRLHDKYPEDIRATMALAAHANQRGNTAEAVQILTDLLAVDPNNAEAYNQIGYFHGFRGDYEKAIDNLKMYQFMAPDQANPHDSLGEIQAYSGRYDEAIASLHRALALKPDFYEAHNHLGVAYEGKGDYRRAIESYLRAAEEAITASVRPGIVMKAIRAALIAGDAKSARELAARVAAYPKDDETEVRLGACQIVLDLLEGRPAEAERRLREIKPRWEVLFRKEVADPKRKAYWAAWNMLMVRALVPQGRTEEAIALSREMVDPPNPWGDFEGRRHVYEGRAVLAELLARKGELAAAEALLEQNRKWNPSWAPTRPAELAVSRMRREKVLAAAH